MRAREKGVAFQMPDWESDPGRSDRTGVVARRRQGWQKMGVHRAGKGKREKGSAVLSAIRRTRENASLGSIQEHITCVPIFAFAGSSKSPAHLPTTSLSTVEVYRCDRPDLRVFFLLFMPSVAWTSGPVRPALFDAQQSTCPERKGSGSPSERT